MEHILRRIRGEYLEMPGLRLTRAQAQRLWALDEPTCAQLLELLIKDRFLYLCEDGTYARRVDGPAALPARRMAKAAAGSPSALTVRPARAR